jgi:hypothetical protein
MRLPAAFSFASLALFAGVAALTATVACSNQGEGEFCDINAGVLGGDCQDGLQCVAAPGLQATPNGDRNRCCPVAGGVPTTAVCMANAIALDSGTEVIDASEEASPEAAPAKEAGGSSEASTDARNEAAPVTIDASSDATVGDAAIDSGAPDADGGPSTDASDAAHD